MKYIFLAISFLLTLNSFSQSKEEELIKQQLSFFEKSHNNRNVDSMMLVVSKNYEEVFLPNMVYNAASIKDYYNNLVNNRDYRSVIDYKIENLEANGKTGTSNVTWDYIIFPNSGRDTLYYARNRGMIQWQKEGESWKMHKVFAGNMKEVNNLNKHAAQKSIETEMLDWLTYYNSKNIHGAMSIYDHEVKGISSFNGSFILYDDLKKEYERLFDNDKLQVTYELDGLEELEFSHGMAYSISVWKYKVYNNETKVLNETPYRHLSIWKQQPSGRWKIVSFVRKEVDN